MLEYDGLETFQLWILVLMIHLSRKYVRYNLFDFSYKQYISIDRILGIIAKKLFTLENVTYF